MYIINVSFTKVATDNKLCAFKLQYPIQQKNGLNSKTSYEYDENSHQVKLHLNLYPDKPQKSNNGLGMESISLGPFSYNANGRQEPSELLKSYAAKESSKNPIFGKINPSTLLNFLLKSKTGQSK